MGASSWGRDQADPRSGFGNAAVVASASLSCSSRYGSA